MRKRKKKDSNLLIYGFAVAALVLIFLFVKRGIPGGADEQDIPEESIAQGISFLESMDERSVEEVEAVQKEQRRAVLVAESEEKKEELRNGDVDVWSLFQDYALLGDSRAVGYYYYDYLSEDRVMAEGGLTIRDIETYMEDLISLNPSSIFLCFGLNDVSIGYWDTPEEYAEEYLEILNSMQERIPDTTIYVSSILPARDPAFERSEKWRRIPEFSAKVEEMCEENGYSFVNNDEISEEYSDLWDSDGIHLNREFYPYWATNLILAMYDHAEAELVAEAEAEGEV